MKGSLVDVVVDGRDYPLIVQRVIDDRTLQAGLYTLINGPHWQVEGYPFPHQVLIRPPPVLPGSFIDVIVDGQEYPLMVRGFNQYGILAGDQTIERTGRDTWQVRGYPVPHRVEFRTTFPVGIKELDTLIMLELDPQELAAVCQTNEYLRNICSDDQFWRQKLLTEIDPLALKLKPARTTYRQLYEELHLTLARLGHGFVISARPDLLIGLVSLGVAPSRYDISNNLFEKADRDFIKWYLQAGLQLGRNKLRRILDLEALEWLLQTHGLLPSDLGVALERGRLDTAEWLWSHGVPYKHNAENILGEGQWESLKWLADKGIVFKESLLEMAIDRREAEVAQWLISIGTPVSKRSVLLLLRNRDADALQRLNAMGIHPTQEQVNELSQFRKYETLPAWLAEHHIPVVNS